MTNKVVEAAEWGQGTDSEMPKKDNLVETPMVSPRDC